MSTLLYEGSVKNLWSGETTDLIEFEYTNAYSVFDWGRMPDALEGKGKALASIGAYFFELLAQPETWRRLKNGTVLAKTLRALDSGLCSFVEHELSFLTETGLRHHFLEKKDEDRFVVNAVPILKPVHISWGNRSFYHYSTGQGSVRTRLLPLEVVFRWGMPAGSSLKERLTDGYAHELGFEKPPVEGQSFSFPVIEFFSKLEPTDRFLSWEQALNYSCISLDLFQKMLGRTLLLSVFLKEHFQMRGLELWDGKFEWAVVDGELLLVDSVGPDELRLLFAGTDLQVSKEFLRQFYRKTSWYEHLQKVKKDFQGTEWKAKMRQMHGEPPKLSEPYRKVAELLYPVLSQVIQAPLQDASAQQKLATLKKRMRACQNS